MKNDKLKHALNVWIHFVIIFFIVAFIVGRIDPMTWRQETRAAYILFCIMWAVFYAFMLSVLHKKRGDDS
jgi:cell division protein FtsW (lipid II flippase)